MLMWMVAWALAAPPCESTPPPLRERLLEAWAQYNDAEVDRAKGVIQSSLGELACQATVVSPDDLLELYRLDALTSITRNDAQGAVYATLRAVAVDHDGAVPPELYGPYLIELYESWSGRLSGTLIHVAVDGGGRVFVGGRPVPSGVTLQVAQGEHLVQVDVDGVVRSELVDLKADHVVVTGVPGPSAPPFTPPAPAPTPPEPVAAVAPPPVVPVAPPMVDDRRRRRPLWVFGGAVLTSAGASFALGSASVSERNFRADPYEGYGSLRGEAISRDARAIRTAYLTGYGLAGLSGVLWGVGVVGFPTMAGPTVGWRVSW